MQPREKAFVFGGIALSLAVAAFKFAPSLGASSSGESSAALLARIESFENQRKRVAQAAGKLKVELPTAGPLEQEVRIREKLAQLGQGAGLQVGAIRRIDRAARSASAQSAVDFQMDLTGPYESLVKFVNALEASPMPFQVSELRVEQSTGGGGGGGGPRGGGARGGGGGGERNPTGAITSTIKVRGYIFPRVFEEKKTEKPAAAPSRPAPSAPRTATPAPQNKPTSATTTAEKKATPTPTPVAEATAAPVKPAPAGARKFRMKMQGMEMSISVEGRTATVTMPDGSTQTREMSDEEYAKFQDGSAFDEMKQAGGEITEE